MQNADDAVVREELVSGSKRLFVFFGGIIGQIGMPPFEFYRASNVLDASRIFVRDPSQSWYQHGLPGIADDLPGIARYLRGRMEASGALDFCFVGNSMGGFAALLFCAMLRQGRVVAFAPQTFISAEKRLGHGDQRWAAKIAAIHASRTPQHVYDLRRWIGDNFPTIRADIYVSLAEPLDVVHADELLGLRNCTIHRFGHGGHTLVRELRDAGLLATIFDGSHAIGKRV